jgi:putative colanic acid biosynthesis UDP-glucose lipid carrier transferase
MHTDRELLSFLRAIIDMLVIAVVAIVSAKLALLRSDFMTSRHFLLVMIGVEGIWILSAKAAQLYQDFRSRDFVYELVSVFKSSMLLLIGTIVVLFFVKELELSRAFVLIFAVLSAASVSIEKYFVRMLLKFARRKSKNLRNVLIIGAGKMGLEFARAVQQNPHFGYKVVGFLDDNQNQSLDGFYLGLTRDMQRVLRDKMIDDVVITLPGSAYRTINECVRIASIDAVRTRIIPNLFQGIPLKYHSFAYFEGFPILTVGSIPLAEYQNRISKRVFDVIFASVVIAAVLSWLIPLIWVFQRFMSPGPLFFVQDRIGKNKSSFKCLKFRTMTIASCNDGCYTPTCDDDVRVTRLGKFLRKANIDEIPQFLNVLVGDMSVVGPRAHAIPFHEKYKNYAEFIQLRNLVKPGITGWAQINGFRGDVTDEEENKKRILKRVEHDVWYVENWSLWLDLQIIIRTIWTTINGDPHAC